MSDTININNSTMALVILILFCLGDPDLLDMIIKLVGALTNYLNNII